MIAQWGALPISFALAAGLTPLVIRVARARGWIANPSAERWHSEPTALMGGVAIVAAAAASFAFVLDVAVMWPLLAGAAIMFVAGAWDDRRGLSPATKIIVQIIAAALFVRFGAYFDLGLSVWVEAPLTMLWLIGITNAVNLIDNMDGLSAGVSAIAAISLAAMGFIVGSQGIPAAALAIAGAAGGFLIYNFKPAKIFMGDCGSLFLGFSLAALAVLAHQTMAFRGLLSVFMTAIVLAVPIIDTTLVTIVRTTHGRPVSVGGRDHSSHRLVYLGLSDVRAVKLLYAVAAGFGLFAVWFYISESALRLPIAIAAFLGAASFGVVLAAANVYEGAEFEGEARSKSLLRRLLTLPREVFGSRWKPVFAVFADALTVVAAFVAAFVLRHGVEVGAAEEAIMRRMVPFVLLIRLPIFAFAGLYRAIWRHAGAVELVRLILAASLGSLFIYSGITSVFGPGAVARGIVVIDWMATILGVMMTRFAFRGLRSYLTAKAERGAPVAVYGASDDALLAVRHLREQEAELGLRPVAIVTDGADPEGSSVQGLTVYAGLHTLAKLKESAGIGEVIVPHNHITEEERKAVERACREARLRCRRLTVSLEDLSGEPEAGG